ncbi:MAG: hypothetical protein R3344_08385, partial [Acidobacteriota bacterium]|nr:hypothetical protein [Acidobacteriota bacterium]
MNGNHFRIPLRCVLVVAVIAVSCAPPDPGAPLLDQIRNGIFLLDVEEERIYAGERAITEEGPRTIQQDQSVRVMVRVRRDA